MDAPVNIKAVCGTKPIRIALIDGYGGDTWRRITHAALENEASLCKNIKEVRYTNAGGNAQSYNAAINSYTAQGFNIIIAFADFGDFSIPAFRKAYKAGVTMVPYFGHLDGKAGRDYSVNPYQDGAAMGEIYAKWMGKVLDGRGNVLFLGGPAGASSSTAMFSGFKEGLKDFPDIKLLEKQYIVTNWNPADAQKAASGLIAKYSKIDGIASDYGVQALATVKTFEQSGVKVPAIAVDGTDNEMNCLYIKHLQEGNAWPYFALDGTSAAIRVTLYHALAAFNKVSDTVPLGMIPYVFANSAEGIRPKCSKNAPPDADMSSLLPASKLQALFNK